MTLTLKTMALAKYGTIAAFAEAAGRTRRSANRLLDPGANLGIDDMHLLINLLDIPHNMVNPLFFGRMYETESSINDELLWALKHCPKLIELAIAFSEENLTRKEATT